MPLHSQLYEEAYSPPNRGLTFCSQQSLIAQPEHSRRALRCGLRLTDSFDPACFGQNRHSAFNKQMGIICD